MDIIFVHNTRVTVSCSHWLLGGSSCFYEQTCHQDTYNQHRCSSHSLLPPHSHINPVDIIGKTIVIISTCAVSARSDMILTINPICTAASHLSRVIVWVVTLIWVTFTWPSCLTGVGQTRYRCCSAFTGPEVTSASAPCIPYKLWYRLCHMHFSHTCVV